MPFSLRNAAQTFQHFIDQVLSGWHFCYTYIDDLLIASPTPQEHQQHLRAVFQHLSDYGPGLGSKGNLISGHKRLLLARYEG